MSDRHFYDKLFAKTRGRQTFTARIIVNSILGSMHRLGLRKNQGINILELGCGKGWLAAKLASYGSVVAVDMAEKTLEENRRLYPEVEFRVGNVIEDIGYDAQFDLVVSMEVIEHVNYDKQHLLIENARRYLKPGGCLILSTPNREVNEKLGVKGYQPVEDWLTLEEVRSRVSDRLEIVELYSVVFRFRIRLLDALWKRLFYPINLYVVQKLFRNTGRGAHVIVVARKQQPTAGERTE